MTVLARTAAVGWALLSLCGCAVPLPPDQPQAGIPVDPLTTTSVTPLPPSGPRAETSQYRDDAPPRSPAPPSASPTAEARPATGTVAELPAITITVTATSLSGFWALSASTNVDIEVGLLSGLRIRYSGEVQDRDICSLHRQGETLRATCIAGFTPTASGSVDDGQIALRWWSGPATVIFHGQWGGNETIGGTLSGGMVGLSVTGTIPASLHKLSPQPTPPSAAMMEMVFDDLRRGSLTAGRYEAMAAKHLKPAWSWGGAKAPTHDLTYLGQIHIRWHRWQTETIQDVYDVQSPGDHSLCRIAVSERGLVIDFACQATPD